MSEKVDEARIRLVERLKLAAGAATLACATAFCGTAFHDAVSAEDLLQTSAGPPPGAPSVNVAVISKPKGATVSIGGEIRGVTPTTFEVRCTPGERITVTVSLEGYAEWLGEARCENGELATVEANLVRLR